MYCRQITLPRLSQHEPCFRRAPRIVNSTVPRQAEASPRPIQLRALCRGEWRFPVSDSRTRRSANKTQPLYSLKTATPIVRVIISTSGVYHRKEDRSKPLFVQRSAMRFSFVKQPPASRLDAKQVDASFFFFQQIQLAFLFLCAAATKSSKTTRRVIDYLLSGRLFFLFFPLFAPFLAPGLS